MLNASAKLNTASSGGGIGDTTPIGPGVDNRMIKYLKDMLDDHE